MEKLELKDNKQKGLVERYYWNPLSRANYRQLLEILFESISAGMISHFSHVQLFVTLLTVARQAPLSMGISRQEYWSGLPCPPPGKNTGVGCHALLQGIFWTRGSNLRLLRLLHWQAGSLPLAPPGKPWVGPKHVYSGIDSQHGDFAVILWRH